MALIHKKISAAILCLFFCMTAFSGNIRTLAYVTVEAEIPVSCVGVTNADHPVYEIQIHPENNAPAPVSDTLQVSEMGMGRFQIEIHEPGTYIYRLNETQGNDPKIQYDHTVYIVTVTVVQYNEETLEYSVSVHGAGHNAKADVIEFHNVIRREVDAPATVPVETAPMLAEETESVQTAASVQNTTAQQTTQISSVTTAAAPAETGSTPIVSEPGIFSPVQTGTPGGEPNPPAVCTPPAEPTVCTAEPAPVTTRTESVPVQPVEKTVQLTPIRTWIDNVLTGDRFPLFTVLFVMLGAAAAAVCAFLLKRKHGEEEAHEE